jgi:hypothetical protein
MSSHWNSESLLRISDGDLNDAGHRLAECGECQGRLSEIDEGLRIYFDYRAAVPAPPPSPWTDLRAGMAEVDVRVRNRRRAERHSGGWLRWAVAGLAAAALVAAYYRYQGIPSVQAAQLLRKAVAAAQAPKPGARIRLHNRQQDLVRPALMTSGSGDDFARLFADAGYAWAQPFSAQSFAAWRDRLADKTDSVELEAKDSETGGPAYRIRTSSGSNAIAHATLVLRAGDYLPIREILEFRGSDPVEITSAIPAPAASGGPPAPSPGPGVAPALPVAVRELHALAALHGIHADLG